MSNAGAQFYLLLGFVIGCFFMAIVIAVFADWTRP